MFKSCKIKKICLHQKNLMGMNMFAYSVDRCFSLDCLGIVPQFCSDIFKSIDEKKKAGEQAEYEVSGSI